MSNTQNPKEEQKFIPWLDAHYNPVASLYTFSSGIGLADLHGDGDYKLVVADLGSGNVNMKLKVYKGTALMSESAIVDLPTAISIFYMDTNEPKTPAIAVASGPYIYIYKNLRPYFKFSLPLLEIDPLENDVWNQAKNEHMDPGVVREMLLQVRNESGASSLTARSLKLIQLPPEEVEAYINLYKHTPLKKQSVVTCMDTLRKSSNEEISISCLVVGSESKEIYVLDSEAFTILSKAIVPDIPVFVKVTGLFDVDYRIMVACRNAKIYSIKKGKELFLVAEMPYPIVSFERVGKQMIVATMDQKITCLTTKGKKLWAIHLTASVTAMAMLNNKSKNLKALLVALDNGEVHTYREKVLCDTMKTQDVVTAMKFGRFGREEGTLIMATKGGGLLVKILKRQANFENTNVAVGAPPEQMVKLNIPKKTKLFVDQALRERENSEAMHRAFQSDLFKLRLNTARTYAKTLETNSNPVSSSLEDPVKLSAKVQGLGPMFQLIMIVSNTSVDVPVTDLLITFSTDNSLYKIQNPLIEVAIVLPGVIYQFGTLVECVAEKGYADKIKVFLLRRGNPVPVITAVINMPVSETLVVV